LGDHSKGAGERYLERFGAGGSVCEVVRLGRVGVSLILDMALSLEWISRSMFHNSREIFAKSRQGDPVWLDVDLMINEQNLVKVISGMCPGLKTISHPFLL
jgi:hypothetical protein